MLVIVFVLQFIIVTFGSNVFSINDGGLLPVQYLICIGFGFSVILVRFLIVLVPEHLLFKEGIGTKEIKMEELKKFSTLNLRK